MKIIQMSGLQFIIDLKILHHPISELDEKPNPIGKILKGGKIPFSSLNFSQIPFPSQISAQSHYPVPVTQIQIFPTKTRKILVYI